MQAQTLLNVPTWHEGRPMRTPGIDKLQRVHVVHDEPLASQESRYQKSIQSHQCCRRSTVDVQCAMLETLALVLPSR